MQILETLRSCKNRSLIVRTEHIQYSDCQFSSQTRKKREYMWSHSIQPIFFSDNADISNTLLKWPDILKLGKLETMK